MNSTMTEIREHHIKFIPNPVQKQFIESQANADLFSSRMGEGKSTALSWAAYYHTRHNPGAAWVIIRDTWENLRATTQKSFFEWFPPGIMGEYHATNKEFTWASGVADGVVTFLGMDDPGDATKLMSREISGFAIDEPAPAVASVGVAEEIFDMAMSRLRKNPTTTKWYAAKLAENNPDEAHWTYKKFVSPGTPPTPDLPGGFAYWQPSIPENIKHLPRGYYNQLAAVWAHRPDLVRRFVEGDFGFQSIGKAVTPQWNDKIHLAIGLTPIKGQPLVCLWDWGHNPTCIITQRTPLGHWHILEAYVGEGIGAEELIEGVIAPIIATRYKGYPLQHIGDPAGDTPEQTSIVRTAVLSMRRMLGGTWRAGPVKPIHRIPPLQAVLSRSIGGRAVVRVDRDFAAPVWHALRGGWHYHVAKSGLVSPLPFKDIHSHPGDAMSYGAAILYPMAAHLKRQGIIKPTAEEAVYFAQGRTEEFRIGPGSKLTPPEHGAPLLPR